MFETQGIFIENDTLLVMSLLLIVNYCIRILKLLIG